MPQSLVKVWIHAVFSTKNREPMIIPPYEYEIYRQMREKLYALGGEVLALDGTEDHVHLLFRLPVTTSLANVMQAVKGGTSH